VKNKGRIVVLTAPSGAGKTSIKKEILKENPDFIFSISATTRAKRENEIDGVDYFFLLKEDFESKISNNEFVEWEKLFDNYYGTLKSFLDENIDAGKIIIMDIDVKGAESIKSIYNDAIVIFIAPPDLNVLKSRLEKRRSESSSSLEKRINRADMEMEFKDKFDYLIVNNDLDIAIEEVSEILKNELQQEE
jgi:guanylate kinase